MAIRASKAKFAPRDWTPRSLAYPKGQAPTLSLLDALAAFTPYGFLRFGSWTERRTVEGRLAAEGSFTGLEHVT